MKKVKESDIKLVVPYVDPVSRKIFGIWTSDKIYIDIDKYENNFEYMKYESKTNQ